MSEVFGKKPFTSREFPVLIFDAGGTLLHHQPSVEKLYFDRLQHLGVDKKISEIEEAMIATARDILGEVERNPEVDFHSERWPEGVLRHLKIPSEKIPDLLSDLEKSLKVATKLVISEDSIETCEQLRERGYRLAVAANWDSHLPALLRLQGLLHLFETVLTSEDLAIQKPRPEFFKAVAEDLDIPPAKCIYVGDTYAFDVFGATRAGMEAVLYDPTHRELKSLFTEDEKAEWAKKHIVSIQTLKSHRRLMNVHSIDKFSELLKICL